MDLRLTFWRAGDVLLQLLLACNQGTKVGRQSFGRARNTATPLERIMA